MQAPIVLDWSKDGPQWQQVHAIADPNQERQDLYHSAACLLLQRALQLLYPCGHNQQFLGCAAGL